MQSDAENEISRSIFPFIYNSYQLKNTTRRQYSAIANWTLTTALIAKYAGHQAESNPNRFIQSAVVRNLITFPKVAFCKEWYVKRVYSR